MQPRLTQTLYALTTRVFRCEGLAPSPPQNDRFGRQDLWFWLALVVLGAAWYFLLFEPQRERNQMLTGRLAVLQAQQRAEELEGARIGREVRALQHGAPEAWERAARKQLGWLKPGETVDPVAWRREHPAWDPRPRPAAALSGTPAPGPRPASAPAPAGTRPPPAAVVAPLDRPAAARSAPPSAAHMGPVAAARGVRER